ncbi:MAG: hypothetical protein WBQ26_04675 [Gemmatimonadaceae bacterium]
MMLAALVAAALLQAAGPADTITSYGERIVLTGDRAAIALDVVVAGAHAGVVEIPVAWPLGGATRLELPPGASAEIQSGASVSRLLVRLAGGGAARIRAEFAGRALGDVFAYRFANATGTTIDEYHLVIELPPGRLARNVSYTIPPSDRRAGVWPMSPDTADDRRAVRLSVGGLAAGDVVSVTVETAPEQRSWAVLVAAVLLAVLYLVRFRDLPLGARAERAARSVG